MKKKRNWRKFFGKYNMVLIGGTMFFLMVLVAFLRLPLLLMTRRKWICLQV